MFHGYSCCVFTSGNIASLDSDSKKRYIISTKVASVSDDGLQVR